MEVAGPEIGHTSESEGFTGGTECAREVDAVFGAQARFGEPKQGDVSVRGNEILERKNLPLLLRIGGGQDDTRGRTRGRRIGRGL